MILPSYETQLYQYITGITKQLDQFLIQINGMPDHLHIFFRLRPNMTPAQFIGKIKSSSSKWINEQGFLENRFEWQRGGATFTISQGHVDRVRRYIQNQKTHHQKQDFRNEYVQMLVEHKIDFDPEYLPDFF